MCVTVKKMWEMGKGNAVSQLSVKQGSLKAILDNSDVESKSENI